MLITFIVDRSIALSSRSASFQVQTTTLQPGTQLAFNEGDGLLYFEALDKDGSSFTPQEVERYVRMQLTAMQVDKTRTAVDAVKLLSSKTVR